MILDAKSGLKGVVVDADTSERIPFVKWANLDTGEYRAWACTPDGRRRLEPRREITGRRRVLRFIPFAPKRKPSLKVECAAERSDRLEHERQIACRRVIVPGILCEVRGCGRLAEYGVSDEQELEPSIRPDGVPCERAASIRQHLFCSRHYRLPVFTSLRGVESEANNVTVRPQ